jgi:large subunit ribosomal protein L10
LRKAQKEQLVAQLAELAAASPHIIVTGYRGLTVKEMTELRRALAKLGVRLKVVKKTLFRRALGEGDRAALAAHLEGPVAAAFVTGDAVAVVKELSAFARTHEELEFRGGWFENQLFDGPQLLELAKLPSREELLARLAGVLSAPLGQLVGVLQAVPRDLVLSLQALVKQREEAGAPAAG